jgi:hypothetical protein
MSDKALLQRAWDSLAIWKETYPEGWDDADEQLLNDLLVRTLEIQQVELIDPLTKLNKAAEDNGELI